MLGYRFITLNQINRKISLNARNFNSATLRQANESKINHNDKTRRWASTYNFMSQPTDMASQSELQVYRSHLPKILEEFSDSFIDMQELQDHYVHILRENCSKDKQATGILAFKAFKSFASDLNSEKLRQISILGWCIDMLLCSIQMTDDIIDKSTTRNGVPCWYTLEDVGLKAINDTVLIENAPYVIMKYYFSNHSCYVPCTEWLHEAAIKTTLGQVLDSTSTKNGRPKFEVFDTSRHNAMAKYKGTYPEFLLPVRMALHLSGKYTPESYLRVKNFFIEMGEYFTRQNDILDCYMNPELTGKISSDDIREGRGCWLITAALKKATPGQKQILYKHYGKNDVKSEELVRKLYEEMKLLDDFLLYEEQSYQLTHKNIEKITDLPREFFVDITDAIYGCSDKQKKRIVV